MFTYNIEGRTVQLERGPDHCPICHHAIEPSSIIHSPIGLLKDQDFRVEVVFRCPKRTCNHLFVARCVPDWPPLPANFAQPQVAQQRAHINPIPLVLIQVVPTEFESPKVPAEVAEVSPTFQIIYSQAAAAETYGLSEIAGVGLRKALEFLIKDFASQKHPESSEKIKAAPLSVCIRDFVDDPNVKACANRATWLGNDETHYVRRWEGKDIKDLKVLVQLTIGWVHNSVLTDKYLAEMPADH